MTDTVLRKIIEQGRASEKLFIAKNLKSDGVPLDVIVKNTGLSFEEVERL